MCKFIQLNETCLKFCHLVKSFEGHKPWAQSSVT